MNHLAIIGAGNVGTAIAFTALNRGIARHLSLFDVDRPRAIGEMLDLRDGLQFVRPATIEADDRISVCADADVVVITAGAKQRPGESRLDLAKRNAVLLGSLLPDITSVAPEAVLLIVTNPVDVLTQLAIDMTGRSDGTVFGSGTVLDSSRLRHLIALRFGIAERHVHAHVVGEHGDSETVLWSSANIGGAPLSAAWAPGGGPIDEAEQARLLHQVRNAAYEIIAGKGATSWAIALATAQILDALEQTTQSAVLPVTGPLDADLGLGEVCVSLPAWSMPKAQVGSCRSQRPTRR